MAINFPDSPSDNDIYTVNGKRWIYSSGKWSIYGSTAPDATASDTEPSGVGDGHIWYRSDQSQTLIRYDNTWVEVGSAGGFDNASTNFPTSLDSATGFAAVEALQAKVGADSSAVTSSHDYKIADHASRLTTLEGVSGPGLVHISRTTIGSAVSSVTVSGAFSSDYDAYRVIIANVDGTVLTAALRIRFGSVVTGYYGSRRVDLYTGSTSTIVRDNNTASCQVGIIATSDNSNSIFDIQNPNLANRTYVYGFYNGGGYTGWFGGTENSTTQHTAFDILPNSGTITGGTIDLYGYAKA